MTPDEIEQRVREIGEREAKATPPPWQDDWSGINGPDHYGGHKYSPRIFNYKENQDSRDEDVQFLFHAREDIPFLLAERDRLKAENEALQRDARIAKDLSLIDEKLGQIRDLESALRDRNRTIRKLQEKIETMDSTHKAVGIQSDAIVANLRCEVRSRTIERGHYQSVNQRLEAEVERLKAWGDSLVAKVNARDKENARLGEALRIAQGEETRDTIADLRRELQAQQAAGERRNRAMRALQNKVETLPDKLRTHYERRHRRVVEHRRQLWEENQRLGDDFTRMRKAYDNLLLAVVDAGMDVEAIFGVEGGPLKVEPSEMRKLFDSLAGSIPATTDELPEETQRRMRGHEGEKGATI